ncbi:MAG: serine/threonine protein kinase, bacterial, partial [Mycobacterium sp.]|nr:serine/threonine protein kinase, bacterial [Mycobacterium sp.]
MIPTALLTVAVIAAVSITGYLLRPQHAAPPGQTPLPFTGLFADSNVAVDRAGSLYVTEPACQACPGDRNRGRVLRLPAGSSTPVEVAFTGLASPRAVAVDTAGNLYVADSNGRVVKLAA